MDPILLLALGTVIGLVTGLLAAASIARRRRRPRELAVEAELQAARQRAERATGEAQAIRTRLVTAEVLAERSAQLEQERDAARADAAWNAAHAVRLESELAALRTAGRSRSAVATEPSAVAPVAAAGTRAARRPRAGAEPAVGVAAGTLAASPEPAPSDAGPSPEPMTGGAPSTPVAGDPGEPAWMAEVAAAAALSDASAAPWTPEPVTIRRPAGHGSSRGQRVGRTVVTPAVSQPQGPRRHVGLAEPRPAARPQPASVAGSASVIVAGTGVPPAPVGSPSAGPAPVAAPPPAPEHEPVHEPQPVPEPVPEPQPVPHPRGWAPVRPGLSDPWTWLGTPSAAGGPYEEDDLQAIHGVGPYLARRLREEGILTWRQVAEWDEEDMALVSRRIGSFADRIRREEWSASARALHEARYGDHLS